MQFTELFNGFLSLGILLSLATPVVAAEVRLTGDSVGEVTIHPVNHATLLLGWSNLVIYVDPVGGGERFAGLPKPDLILITHAHYDHFDLPTLKAIATPETLFVAPAAVAEQLPEDLKKHTTVMTNGEDLNVSKINIDAIPAYNTTPERLQYHAKGVGNGYVLTLGDKRVYISGDTEDIPEMRALKNIDIAFLCMNLPYTMTIEQAASATRAFRPKIVYPYHYKAANLPASDLKRFKKLVGTDLGIDVRLRDWYQ